MENKRFRFGVIVAGNDGTYYKQFILATTTLQMAREIAGTIKGKACAVVEIIPGRAIVSGSMAGRAYTNDKGGGVKILEERKAVPV